MTTLMQIADNVSVDLLDGLAMFDDPKASSLVVQDACRGYATVGLCYLLQRGDVLVFRRWLVMGAQAYANWLGKTSPREHTHAHAEPFSYAVMAGDERLMMTIHQRLRPDFNQGFEYEEDFAYARILQVLACVKEPLPEAKRLLAFWHSLSDGKEPDYQIAQALIERDTKALTDVLIERLDERLKNIRQRNHDGSGNPDERLTLDRVDLETATVVRIAREHLAIPVTFEHRLLPAELFAVTDALALPADAWRDEKRYRVYEDA